MRLLLTIPYLPMFRFEFAGPGTVLQSLLFLSRFINACNAPFLHLNGFCLNDCLTTAIPLLPIQIACSGLEWGPK
jgi:hypothetical protein